MKLIILGGQSISNKEWVEDIKKEMDSDYEGVHIQYYDHWETGDSAADVAAESEKLIDTVKSLDSDYIIFAKSIGTVIFVNSLDKLSRFPHKVVMVGVPLKMATEKGYDFMKLKHQSKFSVSIHQKKFDPFSDYEDLKILEGGLVTVSEYQCNEEPENDHHYANMSTVRSIILGS